MVIFYNLNSYFNIVERPHRTQQFTAINVIINIQYTTFPDKVLNLRPFIGRHYLVEKFVCMSGLLPKQIFGLTYGHFWNFTQILRFKGKFLSVSSDIPVIFMMLIHLRIQFYGPFTKMNEPIKSHKIPYYAMSYLTHVTSIT